MILQVTKLNVRSKFKQMKICTATSLPILSFSENIHFLVQPFLANTYIHYTVDYCHKHYIFMLFSPVADKYSICWTVSICFPYTKPTAMFAPVPSGICWSWFVLVFFNLFSFLIKSGYRMWIVSTDLLGFFYHLELAFWCEVPRCVEDHMATP